MRTSKCENDYEHEVELDVDSVVGTEGNAGAIK